MMFGVVFRVIGSNVEEISVLVIFDRGLSRWDFGQNFKFAKTFCIGKRSREMISGVVLE